MQEKGQFFSPIKQRILLFYSNLGISKRQFYDKIGVSRGTLESKTGATEDVVAKFLATYPEVSAEWLITGEGEMIKHSGEAKAPAGAVTTERADKAPAAPSNSYTDRHLLDIIRQQAEEIGRLKERLHTLQTADKTDKNSPPNTT